MTGSENSYAIRGSRKHSVAADKQRDLTKSLKSDMISILRDLLKGVKEEKVRDDITISTHGKICCIIHQGILERSCRQSYLNLSLSHQTTKLKEVFIREVVENTVKMIVSK